MKEKEYWCPVCKKMQPVKHTPYKCNEKERIKSR